MTLSTRLLTLSFCLSLCGGQAFGQDLLTAGDFESPGGGGEIPSWELAEFRTGDPNNTDVNSGQLIGFANSDFDADGAGTGLWVRAFVGNPDDGTAEVVLSQTVSATPGETYNFAGDALFEGNYAGGVSFLDILSPFGGIESPTSDTFQIDFLDSGGSVIGTVSNDLSDDVFNGFGWTSGISVSGVAPAGTTDVRVSAIGSGLAFNVDPGQSAFYDNFSLTTSSAPATELLDNADLNNGPPDALDFFDVVESPEGSDTISLAGFANDPATGGSMGAWIRAFVEGDSTISQSVPGTPGTEYEFSASSRWEENYSGGQAATGTDTLLELAFLGVDDVVLDSIELDLRTEQMNDNEWRRHTLSGVAPEGTLSVRVAGKSVGTVNTEGAQSAFWDDFSLMVAGGDDFMADFNGDGTVDLLDLDILGANFGGPGDMSTGDANGDGTVDLLDLDILGSEFGQGGGSAAVPEPMGLALAAAAGVLVASRRRRC